MVELTTSILSIRWLYDDVAEEVCFSKKGCRVVDKDGKNMLVIPRSGGSCYSFVIPKGDEHTYRNKETNKPWVLRGQPHLIFSQCYICESSNLENTR